MDKKLEVRSKMGSYITSDFINTDSSFAEIREHIEHIICFWMQERTRIIFINEQKI